MLQKNRPQKCKYQIVKSRASIGLGYHCIFVCFVDENDIRPYALPGGLIKRCVCPPASLSLRPSRNRKAVETSNLVESPLDKNRTRDTH